MKLIEINEESIAKKVSVYTNSGGGMTDASLLKLFECMNDETSKSEIEIKVAALNQIYSTAIQYIAPVVDEIAQKIPREHHLFTDNEYVELVDKIATVNWVSSTTKEAHKRCNISFASKYVHFLSRRKIPIYDSYVWIVMIGYFKQNGLKEYSFSAPASYKEFYDIFVKFKEHFSLGKYSNYELDKFLWWYGKNMINEIIEERGSNLDQAKSILRELIKKSISKA